MADPELNDPDSLEIAVVEMYKHKETRNTVQYRSEEGTVEAIPVLYIQKFAFLDGGRVPNYPEAIIITVERR